MFQFTSKGFLKPNCNIQSSLEALEQEFVVNLSQRRRELFNKYTEYSKQLKGAIDEQSLLQWINGSYVTKEKTPKDIDLVTFIDFQIIDRDEKSLEDFKYPRSAEIYGVDAYIVKVYPQDHSGHSLYIGDRRYWMDRFEKTRRNRFGKKAPKGWLEIIY